MSVVARLTEAGLGLDKPIVSIHQGAAPLIWLGVYSRCSALDSAQIGLWDEGGRDDITDLRLNIDEREYLDSVASAKEYIVAGDVYQVHPR